MGRRLFDGLAHEGRVLGRPPEDGVEPPNRLRHRVHRAQTSSSLRELRRTIANTVRREPSPGLPSSYGACLSSCALKAVHLIAGPRSNSGVYVTVDVFWRTRSFQRNNLGGQGQFASVLVPENNRHYEGFQASFEDH